MCAYCFVAIGTVVGGVAIAKAGGLGAAKTAIVTMMMHRIFRRR